MSTQLGKSWTSVGIDCGTYEVKVAVCEHDGRRHRVTCLASLPTDTTVEAGGVEGLEKSVSKALQKLVQRHKLQGLPAAIGIPINQVVMKWVALPPMDEEDLQQAARTKVRKDLPFPIEQAYLAASKGSRSESGETLVTAVSKTAMKSLASTVMSVGLTPMHAEAEAQAVVRLLQRSLAARKRYTSTASFTLVDLGYATTRMYVIQEGQLRFARSIKFGALNFINRMVEGLETSAAESAQLLAAPESWMSSSGKLHVPYQGQHAIISVDQELLVLTREFQRLIRYFRSIFPSRSFSGMLDSFLLCGGISGLKGLSEIIGNEVQMRMNQIDPLETVNLDLEAETYDSAQRNPSRFTTAMGLALCPLRMTSTSEEEENEFSWARTI